MLGLSIVGCVVLGFFMIGMPNMGSIGLSNFNKIFGISFGIFLITFGAVLIFGFIRNKNRIKLAYTITKVTGKFILDNKATIIVPFVLFLITIAYLFLGIV